jgi:hypothetical protein
VDINNYRFPPKERPPLIAEKNKKRIKNIKNSAIEQMVAAIYY